MNFPVKLNSLNSNWVKFIYMLSFFVLLSHQGNTQVTANFSANKTEGCTPLSNVQFTDFSTTLGGPIISRVWDLGEGAPITGNDSIVFKTYNVPGCYDVSLIVSDGVDFDTLFIEDYICVYDHPNVSFSISEPTGCAPLLVSFYNTSTIADAEFESIEWNFGNVIDSTQFDSTTYIYNNEGTYTVCLTVTDSNGCGGSGPEGTVCLIDTVNVLESPVAGINVVGSPNSCNVPYTVSFENASTGNSIILYDWDFGDLNGSSVEDPDHTYTAQGVYDVSLVVENSLGCSDSILQSDLVSVGGVTGSIYLNQNPVCGGEDLLFSAASNSAISYQWVWDCCGNFTGQSNTLTIGDNLSGFQYVDLILTGNGGCTDTIRDSVFVDQLIANFNLSGSYFCETPFTLDLFDNSTSSTAVSSWQWFINGTDILTTQNPTVILNTEGDVSVDLIVQSENGCVDTASNSSAVQVFVLEPIIQYDDSGGCAPLTVNFAGSVEGGFLDSVATWSWNFGDPGSGANNTSGNQAEAHVFNDPGFYEVVLTVLDVSGCEHTDTFEVVVGLQQNASFTVFPDTSCASDPVLFQNQSTDTNLITFYFWEFGDGGKGIVKDPGHIYLDTGWMNVTLIVENDMCFDTMTVDSAVYILAPVVLPTRTIDCNNPNDIQFTFTNIGADLWYWDFGDGSPIDSSFMDTVHHLYADTGKYTITLTGYNNATGCSYESTISVRVTSLQAMLTDSTPLVCSFLSEVFDASSSSDANTWTWFFGSDTNAYVGEVVQYLFEDSGQYDVTLIVSDTNNCHDTLVTNIEVVYIKADFTVSDTVGCNPLEIQLNNLSYAEYGIETYEWGFSDLTVDSVENPSHVFNGAGTYVITLKVIDSLSCYNVHSFPGLITVHGPNLGFSNSSNICINNPVQFTNSTINIAGNALLYEWFFGDGTSSTDENPAHVYPDTGFYNVTLIALDPVLGCTDTLTDTNSVIIENAPTAYFNATPTALGCYPGFVQFFDTSQSVFTITNWHWIFGDGGTSDSIQNPGHQYPLPGFYDITLIVNTAGGCSDTLVKEDYIEVQGPYAEFSYFPDSICKGGQVTFIIDSMYNVNSFDWDFGNGQNAINVMNDTTLKSYDNSIGTIYPKLIFRSDSSCEKVISDSLYIYMVEADFDVSDSVLCSENASVDLSSNALNADDLQWILGDGTIISNQANINHVFQNQGTYNVQLVISNDETGCMDTATHLIHVGTILNASISNDTSICAGDSLTLFAFAPTVPEDSINWSSNNAYLNNFMGNEIVSYGEDDYMVQVLLVDSNGCVLNDTIVVDLINLFEASFVQPQDGDTSILFGQEVQIEISVAPEQEYIFIWSPEENLDCNDCSDPISSPDETTEYTITILDSLSCASQELVAHIEIIKEVKASVPTAFTPNGDGDNDTIYVRGWGIKELLEYRIYNRWGELVYNNPGDINDGWDGTYKNTVQEMDSYAVTVKALGYNDKVVEYKGFINLIR